MSSYFCTLWRVTMERKLYLYRIVNWLPSTLMFRSGKMSAKLGSANAVQLTSFNHINGDASSQESQSDRVQQIRLATKDISTTEILGPTGTVRGYKNIIRQRKEVLRLSFVGETSEVRLRLKTNSFVVNNLCEQLYLCDKEMLNARYVLILWSYFCF